MDYTAANKALMKEKLIQLNFRVPEEMARAFKAAAAATGVKAEVLGRDALTVYYDRANKDHEDRRRRALPVIHQILDDAKASKDCALHGSNMGPLPCEGRVNAVSQFSSISERNDGVKILEPVFQPGAPTPSPLHVVPLSPPYPNLDIAA